MGPNFSGLNRFRSKSSNNNYYVANNYPTVPTTEPKSKTKLLIIVIVSAVVLIIIFALIGGRTRQNPTELVITSEEQLYADINELKNEWNIFIDEYKRKIGLVPKVTYDEDATFPKGNFANLKEEYRALNEANDKIQKSSLEKLKLSPAQIENISSLKEKINKAIPMFEKNVNTMERIYTSYEPLIGEDSGSCKKTTQINDLIEGEPEEISSAAQNIFDAYCVRITDFKPENFFSEEEYNAILY